MSSEGSFGYGVILGIVIGAILGLMIGCFAVANYGHRHLEIEIVKRGHGHFVTTTCGTTFHWNKD